VAQPDSGNNTRERMSSNLVEIFIVFVTPLIPGCKVKLTGEEEA